MARKLSRKGLVKKLDTVFSQYVRLHHADDRGYCICFTCGKKFYWKEIQAGHFMSRKFYATRWEEDNVKPQCAGCNIFRYGEQYLFAKQLGQATADKMHSQSREVAKISNVELQDKIEHYSALVKNYQYKV